jgi:hypothetical protein
LGNLGDAGRTRCQNGFNDHGRFLRKALLIKQVLEKGLGFDKLVH